MSSPDLISAGFLAAPPSPRRYADDETNDDPLESVGLLRALMPAGVRVLDVGCGAGGGTLAMNKGTRNQVVCLEPDPDRAEVTRGRGLDCRTALFDKSIADELGKFDVVVFGDVLEHMADPASALILARSILNNDGVVLISVPNVAHWNIRVNLLWGKFDYQQSGPMDATHLRWFTYKSLRLMLERCGYRVDVQTGSSGGWLPCYKYIRGKRYVLAMIRKVFPSAFSCQLVVRAKAA